MDISIVIITHNNFSLKHGCIETVLSSVIYQKDIDAEIIIVDNNSNDYNRNKLIKLVSSLENVNVILNNVNNISLGRNLGAKSSHGDFIVFMDDDMVLYNNKILSNLSKLIKNQIYGYSATRLWTAQGWYENNKKNINKNIIQGLNSYGIIIKEPDPEVRKKGNNRHLIRTYIGNFGFIRKDSLNEIGMWDESYTGYGLEDDTMAFKLYLKYGRPFILKKIKVVHIWHEIKKKNYKELKNNRKKFNNLLLSYNVKEFHTGRLLYEEADVIKFYEEEK